MKSAIQKLPQSEVELKIEIPTEEFQGFVEKAIFELGKEIEVKGFRKGQAPKEIIERTVGQEKILEEAAEICIRENYIKAISENKLEPLGEPRIDILKLAQGNPLEFKAKIAVFPEIVLPDYKKIASLVEKKKAEVTKEEIEKLRIQKENMEKERVRQEILEKIAQNSKMEAPLVLIEIEQRRAIEDIKRQVPQILQMTFEDYLKKINKTEKELQDSLFPEAEKRVKTSLILSELGRKEGIEVSEKEMEKEAERISQIYPKLDQERLKEYTKEVIKNEKTLQMLEGLIRS